MLIIKGVEYILTTRVVVIVNDNTDGTNDNSNKMIVNVDSNNSDGNNSQDATT